MKIRNLLAMVLCVGLLPAAACREDAGEPDYASLAPVFDKASERSKPAPTEPVGGPGEKRLSLGIFYEGAYSEIVPIDDQETHYYVYGESFAVDQVEDSVEGQYADRLTISNNDAWGGGLSWNSLRDLSGWTTLHVSLKSSNLEDVKIRLASGPAEEANEIELSASDYGYAVDSEWHSVKVPMADFASKGLDLTRVRVPFALVGESAKAGDELLVDNVYLGANDE